MGGTGGPRAAKSHRLKAALAVAALLAAAAAATTGQRSAALAAPPSANVSVAWTKLAASNKPTGPTNAVTQYDAAGNRLIAFFPEDDPLSTVKQVWVLSNANRSGGAPAWTKLTTAGSAPGGTSSAASVSYIPGSNKLLVYGGCQWACSPARSGAFVLTNANGTGGTPTWSQLAVTNPQPRVAHSSAYDAAGDRLIRFGGGLAFFGTDQNDTATLSNASGAASPSTWTTLPPAGAPPARRQEAATVYDPVSDRMTIIGGYQLVRTCCPYDITEYNDVSVLTGASGGGATPTWTTLAPSGTPPTPRAIMAHARDASTDRAYVFGGYTFNESSQDPTYFGDMFVLADASGVGSPAWLPVTQSGDVPPAMYYATASFDATTQRFIMMGGSDGRVGIQDVWVGQVTTGGPPDCSALAANPAALWPANGRLVRVQLSGATDPDGDPVTLAVTGVTQDEPVTGPGDSTSPDAARTPHPDVVSLRAERSGHGDGRVYRVAVTATDPSGARCEGVVKVGVPRQRHGVAVDSGETYDSLAPAPRPHR